MHGWRRADGTGARLDVAYWAEGARHYVDVTVLRLAAGATVLPHCGVTNRRLIMQFALRGSDGVEFIVGGEARGYGGDGHAIVFDDSFEHQVNHRGPEDRYVFFAILKHPDVADGAYGPYG